ncbi:MAG TPA: hypothetical protein VFL80_03710 [Thermoanaerobaculia bacterium]|nr:hypothetical protein [Thermoanaerobaculia bacterium]
MNPVTYEEVQRVRERIANAHAVAAERFRNEFAERPLPADEAARRHLEIQAAALLESALYVQLVPRDDRTAASVHYELQESIATPYVAPGEPIFPSLTFPREPAAIFEYWMLISEMLASSAWRVTSVVASGEEFDAALRIMNQPQIVRAIPPPFLPAAEPHGDGARFEVTVYCRAEEERVERRSLLLDASNEFVFHSRELIAEGRGGVAV